jgi:hypothetical protein
LIQEQSPQYSKAMKSTFRIWLGLSRTLEPNWSATGAKLLEKRRFASDGYDITVEGDGVAFAKAAEKLKGVASVERKEDNPSAQ